MKTNEVIQLAVYFGLLLALTPVLGRFMARVFQGQKTFLHPILSPLERFVYWVSGVDSAEEMTWGRYFWAVLIFNVAAIVSLWLLQVGQALLPLNPQKFAAVPWALALNTAISFITNTNWQAYSGESTMSCFTQMAGLAVHNFLSAATGIAVMLAITRGLTRASAKTLGNFWVDLTRTTIYILLPLSVVLAVLLAGQGVVQTFKPYASANLVETYTTQVPKTDDKGNPVNGADGKPVMVDQKVATQDVPLGPAWLVHLCGDADVDFGRLRPGLVVGNPGEPGGGDESIDGGQGDPVRGDEQRAVRHRHVGHVLRGGQVHA